MRKFFRANKTVTILLPIIFLIGILILQVFTGDLLSASNKDSLVKVTIDGKEVATDNIETEKESINLTLETKEKALLEIPYDESFSVEPLNNKEESISIEERSSIEFDKKALIKYFKESDDKEELEKTKKYLLVNNEKEKNKSLFLLLDKNKKQSIKVERNTSDKTEVTILNAETPEAKQSILIFKEVLVPENQISKVEEISESKKTEDSSNNKATESVQSKKQKSEKKTAETTTPETKQNMTEESQTAESSSSSEVKPENDSKEESVVESNQNEKPELPKIGSPESYERILAVETTKTKSSLSDLLKEDYSASDSLKKPRYL